MMRARRGFTLVELLIVIVIIGILAAAMLLSGGSATAAAEASNIISDLRSMKTAAVLFYAQNLNDNNGEPAPGTVDVSMLAPYADNPAKFGNPPVDGDPYSFAITVVNGENKWWVGYNMTAGIGGGSRRSVVAERMIGKANSIGLYKDNTDYLIFDDKTSDYVWMIAR